MGLLKSKYEYYDIELMDRKWKLLTPDWYSIKPNAYLISEYGDIYNLRLKRVMKPEITKNKNGDNYKRMGLVTSDGGHTHVLIHRMVALYFLPENDDPYHKIFVDHNDGNKFNNHYSNLEWVTPSENAIRAYKMGLSYTKGENCHLTKYTDEQIHEICKLIELGYSSTQILQKLGLIDFTGYKLYKDHPDYERLKGFVNKLRSRTFRKDIVLQYNF